MIQTTGCRSCVLAVFVATLFLVERQGALTSVLSLVVALCLFAVPLLVATLQAPFPLTRRRVAALLVGAVLLVIAVVSPPWWRSAWAGTALYSWALVSPIKATRRTLQRGAAALGLFAVALPAFDAFPQLLQFEESTAAWHSHLITLFTGRPFESAAGILGFEAGLLFVCFLIVRVLADAGTLRERLLSALAWLFGIQGVPVLVGSLVAVSPSFDAPIQLQPPPLGEPLSLVASLLREHVVLLAPFLSSLLYALGAMRLSWIDSANTPHPSAREAHRMPQARDSAVTHRLRIPTAVTSLLVVVLIGLAGGMAAWLDRPHARRGTTVVFDERGYTSWSLPDWTFFGKDSGGMFGSLAGFVESIGMQSRRTSSLTVKDLRGASIVFIANPEQPLPRNEFALLWRFVSQGGHLVLLGDHTWMRESGNPLNAILEPTEIRFRTDSANFILGGWAHGYRPLLQPLTAGLRPDWNEPSFVVGASLETGPAARPLVIGRWGFSDASAAWDTTGNMLGNLTLDDGERVGDLTLMATQPYGLGRVTVLGDTSAFFNGILMSSHEFVSRLFLWAGSRANDPPFALQLLNALLAFLLGLALAGRVPARERTLVAGAVLAGLVGWLGVRQQQSWPQPFVAGNLAFVDISHVPLQETIDWDDEAVLALPLNLMRLGYQPHFVDHLDRNALDAARLLVLVSPARRIEEELATQIEDWVLAGGRLLVSVGAEEREPLAPLLRRFGASLRAIPLGSVAGDTPIGPVQAVEMWPLEFDPPLDPNRDEVLMQWRDFVLAARLRRGQGQVLLVADSKFFVNSNLEHGDHPHPANINFLALLVEQEPPLTTQEQAGDDPLHDTLEVSP